MHFLVSLCELQRPEVPGSFSVCPYASLLIFQSTCLLWLMWRESFLTFFELKLLILEKKGRWESKHSLAL